MKFLENLYEMENFGLYLFAIIGKIAEIHFFEESNNKKGTCSMRIPIFERIREDKDTESYS